MMNFLRNGFGAVFGAEPAFGYLEKLGTRVMDFQILLVAEG